MGQPTLYCIAVALYVLTTFNVNGDNVIVIARQGTETILSCDDQSQLNDVTSLSWTRISGSNYIVIFTKYYEGDPVFPRPNKYSVYYSYDLEILDVNASDAGSYRCDYHISAAITSRTFEVYVPEVYIDECKDVSDSTCWVNGSSYDSLTCKFSGFPANITVSWQRTQDDEEVLLERSFSSSGELTTTCDKENTSLVCRVADGSGGSSSRFAPYERAVHFLVPDAGNADIPVNNIHSTNNTPIIVMGVIIASLIIIIIVIIIRWKRTGAGTGVLGYSKKDIQTAEEGLPMNPGQEPGTSSSHGTGLTGGNESDVDRTKGTGGIESDVDGKDGRGGIESVVNGKEGTGGIESAVDGKQGTRGIESDVDGKQGTGGIESAVSEGRGYSRTDTEAAELEVLLNHEWKVKADVALSTANTMQCMAATPDGRMAVGCWNGERGIEIYSADGQLQQKVLKGMKVRGIAFLSDGRCAVHDLGNTNKIIRNVSLYTQGWEKVDTRFETLSWDEGGLGELTVDNDDHIYVGYRKPKKIQVFSPAGGKPVREIACDGYQQWQIFAMQMSKMAVVKNSKNAARVINETGVMQHRLIKSEVVFVFPAVCKDDTILIATVNEENRVTIERYTSELQHMATLITDHVIQKTKRDYWAYIQEFTSGEVAFCTADRLYIFS